MPPVPKILFSFPLFKGLSASEIGVFVDNGKLSELKNETLFNQGQKAKYLHAVVSGKIKISQLSAEGHQVVMRWAGPGTLVGGAPIFGEELYPATAQAIPRASILSWDKATILGLLKQYPAFGINTIHFLGAELGQIRLRFHELATENVHRRIARTLLRLVSQFGTKQEDGVLIDFPLSRQDLAEMTGTTLHTVSRILSAWEKKALVKLGRKRVSILNPHQLVILADDIPPK